MKRAYNKALNKKFNLKLNHNRIRMSENSTTKIFEIIKKSINFQLI